MQARCGSRACARRAAAPPRFSFANRAARHAAIRRRTRSVLASRLPSYVALPLPFRLRCLHSDLNASARNLCMRSLDEFATARLANQERNSPRRDLGQAVRVTGIWTLRNGCRLLSFCCNDYLNLTHHPAVVEAATQALRLYGTGAGASRLVTGNHPLYAELEHRLAQVKEAQAACVFGSGYLANLGIIPALIGPEDLILIDELAHACLWGGSRLARAAVVPYRHADLGHVEVLLSELRKRYDRVLIATDGVFSMDGDIAPLHGLAALAQHHDAWLLSDDAHGLGIVGGGRGSSFVQGKKADVPLQMGTLSKALGAYGGYICASATVVDLVRNRAGTLSYSTG